MSGTSDLRGSHAMDRIGPEPHQIDRSRFLCSAGGPA
jgi:hypothetical protein